MHRDLDTDRDKCRMTDALMQPSHDRLESVLVATLKGSTKRGPVPKRGKECDDGHAIFRLEGLIEGFAVATLVEEELPFSWFFRLRAIIAFDDDVGAFAGEVAAAKALLPASGSLLGDFAGVLLDCAGEEGVHFFLACALFDLLFGGEAGLD